jgi:general L-amino acid transport system substrate-binding protein
MRLLAFSTALLALAAAWPAPDAEAQTLAAVRQRGQLTCGTSTGTAGFSAPDAQGVWRGFDVDVCRAVAAAVLGDGMQVRIAPLSPPQRFTALQSGEVDILSRQTTWTLQRDAGQGMNFTAVVYYDGQGFMVPRRLGVTRARELNGATVCLTAGTTAETNLNDFARTNTVSFRPVTFENNDASRQAYFAGRCDAYATDVSALAAVRASMASNPEDHVILPDIVSKEPLTPAVRHGDDQWFDIVRFVIFALIEAEERGVTQANIEQMLQSENPDVRRLLGVTAGNGRALGLDERWAYNAIKAVGNYGEMFERNLGRGSQLRLERGPNALWTQGGLMYAIPLR